VVSLFAVIRSKQLLITSSCACNVWFDFSPTKRKSFSDVASIIETSEYEWLADDLLSTSAINACDGESQLYHIDDTGAYKNVKLSTQDRAYDAGESLERALQDVGNAHSS
jgi:hypothetical protein